MICGRITRSICGNGSRRSGTLMQEEEPAEDLDAYQEFMDYYIGKTRRESIDPTVLPDGEKMSIVRRCTWLAEYIDRAGDGDPHGLLWQIMGDINDIAGFLEKLDDR